MEICACVEICVFVEICVCVEICVSWKEVYRGKMRMGVGFRDLAFRCLGLGPRPTLKRVSMNSTYLLR